MSYEHQHLDSNHYGNDLNDNDKPEKDEDDVQQEEVKEPSEQDPHNYLAKPNHINDMNKSFGNNFVVPDHEMDDLNDNEMIDRPNVNGAKESAKDFKVMPGGVGVACILNILYNSDMD